MAKHEIEIDDKGEFVGAVPAELTAVMEKVKTASYGEGFGKGNQKAAAEAKAQIDSTVAAERSKWEIGIAADRAKWGEIEAASTHLKTQLEATTTQARKTLTEREEAHAQEITRRVDRETKRNDKIRTLVNQNLKALAASAGARTESLGELEVILQHRIGYSDEMEPFVLDEQGQPAKTTAGNPLPLDVFVKQYLDAHPHHRKAPAGQGGGARGGASMHGHTTTATLDGARARVEGGDRSPQAINDLFEAGRKRAAS
jgi:hypothetical protein